MIALAEKRPLKQTEILEPDRPLVQSFFSSSMSSEDQLFSPIIRPEPGNHDLQLASFPAWKALDAVSVQRLVAYAGPYIELRGGHGELLCVAWSYGALHDNAAVFRPVAELTP